MRPRTCSPQDRDILSDVRFVRLRSQGIRSVYRWLHVRVHAEQVLRIVRVLDRDQPVMVLTVVVRCAAAEHNHAVLRRLSLAWFNLAPKAMVVHVRGKRLPAALIAIINYGAWVVVLLHHRIRGVLEYEICDRCL